MILKLILIAVGVTFLIFGYLIYFKKQYNLINDFEVAYKSGKKTEAYAKKVGMTEFTLGILLILIGIFSVV